MKLLFKTRWHNVPIFAITTFFLVVTSILAQEPNQDITIGKRVTIQSDILGESRPLMIYLPDRYNQSKAEYPVLYLLDGGRHFHYASGLIQFLSQNRRAPQMIVVGIPNTNRDRDFTPTQVTGRPETGGADNFVQFLKNELVPYIDNTYRTAPYRLMFGHSATGMFSAYVLLTSPELFNAYIAASPWLAYDEGYLVKKADDFLDNAQFNNHFYYMTIGNEPQVMQHIENFVNILKTKNPAGLDWKFEFLENEDHGSVTLRTLYLGLETLFTDWKIPDEVVEQGVAAIEAHYQKLSDRFGYEIKIPETTLNILGYRYLGRDQIDKAITIFKKNVQLYPESANVYDSLGEGYEAAQRFELARTNYEIAYQKGKSSSDPNTPIYKQHLENIQKKLERTN